MGKDRYSDDHTIEVAGETKTLVISENATVVEDLDVGNDLAVGNNLSVTGTLSAGSISEINSDGTVTIYAGPSLYSSINLESNTINIETNTLDINAGTVSFSSVPELSVAEERYMSYPASSFSFQKIDAGTIPELEEYGRYWLLTDANDPQIFFCPINNIPQGSEITELIVYYKTEHVDDIIQASLYSLDLSDIPGASVIGDVDFTTHYGQFLPTDGGGWTSDSVTQVSIPIINYSDKSYFVRFSGECGSSGTEIALASIRIKYTTKSVGL